MMKSMSSGIAGFGLLIMLLLCVSASLVFAGSEQVSSQAREEQIAQVGRSAESLVPGQSPSRTIRLIHSDERGVELEVLNFSFDSWEERVAGELYHHIDLKGADLGGQPGAPQLPVKVVTLGVPLEAEVRVEVLELETVRKFDYQVYPAPRRVLSKTDQGQPVAATEFYRDEQLYSSDVFYPRRLAEVAQTAHIRDQRVALLEISPFQFNPMTGELLFHKRLLIRVNFQGGSFSEPLGPQPLSMESRFEPILENTLLNYDSSKPWRQGRITSPLSKSIQTETPYDDATAYKIYIDQDGIYSMSYEYLQSQGVNVSSIDPQTVKIYNHGEQIPIHVSGVRDGSFDPGDAIQFWGQVLHGDQQFYSPYTHTNVYWLTSRGEMGLRMVEQDGGLVEENPDNLVFPTSYKATLHEERDLNYERLSQISDESVDRWLWDEINADTTRDYTFPLSAVDDTMECEIEIRLRGITFPPSRPNHHTKIWLNGNKLEEAWWNDQSEYVYHRTGLPGSWLWEGTNLLRISNEGDTQAGDVDKIRVNWFQIDYWRGYQARDNYLEFAPPEGGERGLHEFVLTGFNDPDIELYELSGKKVVNFEVSPDSIFYKVRFQDQIVRDTRYLAVSKSLLKLPKEIVSNSASNLRTTTQGADYVLIVHSDFYQSVLPLAEQRQSQGLRVKVVKVEDVYDEFNDGILSPLAIRDFLKYTYQNWQAPAPTHVLLVGDTSWGYDKPITHQTYWVEPCYVPTIMAWTSAWGVSASDNRLVCLVGDDRLPDMAIGRFPVRSVAESEQLVEKTIEYEANPQIGPWRKRIQLLAGEGHVFERACVELDSGFVPPGYDTPRIYTSPGSIHYGTTQDLLSQWDQGIVLATFSGHGGGSVWFDANFFLLEHVPLLNNGDRLPVVFSLTCFVGYFDNPWFSSLGEEIIRADGRGAIAHFGSSGVAWASEDQLLGENLFQAIFRDGVRSLGLISTQGKLGLQNTSQELIDVFGLLGDPATPLGLPEHEVTLDLAQNSVPMGEPIPFSGTVAGGFSGTVEVSFLDNDTTGWQADTTEIELVDRGFAPRIPVAEEIFTVSAGQFSGQMVPPDTLPEYPWYQFQPGKKGLGAYFWNDQTDAIGWTPVFVDVPFVTGIHHIPEKPGPWEEIWVLADVKVGVDLDADGPDTVRCNWGLRVNQLFNEINMSPTDGLTYQTDAPISAQAGAYVYYQIEVRYGGLGGSPSLHTYLSSIKQLQIARMPNIWVARRDISLMLSGNELRLGCWIHNTGVEDMGPVPVRFYDGNPEYDPDSPKLIGSEQVIPMIPASDSVFASIAWGGPGEPHDLYVWVDPEQTLVEAPTFDNKTHKVFSNLFLVTPGQGTTVWGSNARVVHTAGNAGFRISAAAFDKSSLLVIDDQAPDSSYFHQMYDPAKLEQPGLSFAALKDSSYKQYAITLQDSTVSVSPTAQVRATFWYHPGDSLTNLAIQQDNLKICNYSEQLEKWIICPDQEMLTDSSLVQATISHLGIFGLFIIDDQQPPLVGINVEGQSFADEDYISSNPVISAAIEDANGIDIYSYPIEISLNGAPVPSSDYSGTYSPQTTNLCLVSYMPELSAGHYVLTMKAYDCFGNAAVDTISFNVTVGFDIPWVANHPNPFQSETVIAYVVASDTPADQVTIKIYTVRGRLIWESYDHSVGPGYVEVVWDGRDQDGERVANGVYYYKMTIIDGDGTKHSPILGKMAKLE